MRIKLDLDPEVTERLIAVAVREKRPIVWQAEVMLRRALGLPFPPDPAPDPSTACVQEAQPAQAVQHA